MKQIYTEPELEIITFECDDIITKSELEGPLTCITDEDVTGE